MDRVNTLLADVYTVLPEHLQLLKNGHVIKLYNDLKKEWTVAKKLVDVFGGSESSVYTKIRDILKEFKRLKKSIHRDFSKVEVFLQSVFQVSSSVSAKPAEIQHPPVSVPVQITKKRCHSPTSVPLPPSPKKLRQNCPSCIQQRKCNENLREENRKLLKKNWQARQTQLTLRKAFEVKRINQALKRKDDIIARQKLSIKTLKAEHDKEMRVKESLASKAETNKSQNASLQRTIKKLGQQNQALKAEIENLKTVIKEKEGEIAYLQATVESSDTDSSINQTVVTKLDKKTYSYTTRKVFYKAIASNVPVTGSGTVIEYAVKTLTGKSLSSVPDPSTAAQMALEMGILSDLQVAETMLKGDVLTLAWDATTVAGKHINEIHLCSPSHVLTVNTRELPGGSADDYVQHIQDSLEDLAITYSEASDISKEEVLHSLQSKILSTLTDRAAANHATVVKLQETLDVTLLELNCNLHPLDGLANAARKALKRLDVSQNLKTRTFGGDCSAANVLHGISKLRYKGKGDPAGFITFLKSKKLPAGTFVRYVGNRLHVLFHMAGTVYRHRDLLTDYLAHSCNAQQLGSALLSDLKNPTLLLHLQALGLMGKLVTGPWMALMYIGNHERKHFEMVNHLRHCMMQLRHMEAEPDVCLTSSQDVFGKPLIADDVLLALQITDGTQLQQLLDIIQLLLQEFITILGRQLFRYLHGPLAEPTQAMMRQAESAPCHNIWAERSLGIADAQMRRAPNATMGFVDAKTKVKINNTLSWLEDKSVEQQQKIIYFAIKKAKTMKDCNKLRQANIESKMLKKMKEKGQKRSMTERNKLSKKIQSVLNGESEEDVFNEVSEEIKETLQQFLLEEKSIVGKRILHWWWEDGENKLYNGRVNKIGKNKDIWIGYWGEEEQEDESQDHKMKKIDFLADIATGDLVFC